MRENQNDMRYGDWLDSLEHTQEQCSEITANRDTAPHGNHPASVICVVEEGIVMGAYSTVPVTFEVLDYDNMEAADEGSEEYQEYQKLQERIKSSQYSRIY
ncbi:hypothetical protein H9X81_10350 [Hydrogenoanaerobacterium saccharovorans]|uniref:Uncharacterized protein n=1 Tax=Hydrogenoanaerobacterium saccharovorans TaxID=474960 RepID=A0ABS2GPM5_9FIRM|nr:hypothetical protein [Hydrogenoanaerobacterium saccharovorans]MBM6924083.1 hypothetical protein [Hydrogenoanaerobacterium saccharovorans]